MTSRSLLNLGIVLSLVCAIVVCIGIHLTLTSVLERLDLNAMAKSAAAKSDQLAFQVEVLRDSLSTLQLQAVVLHRARPSLQQIEESAGQHGLDTRRIERVPPARGSKSTQSLAYSISMSGSVFDVVQCLRDLENQFLLHTQQVSLQRGDATGRVVVLTLTLEVAAE